MHYYQWYAMVNHCLALVVSIHKITKENWQGKKNVENQRERERERERERIYKRKELIFPDVRIQEDRKPMQMLEKLWLSNLPRNDP